MALRVEISEQRVCSILWIFLLKSRVRAPFCIFFSPDTTRLQS
jgi:hypothetical protein